MRALEAQAFSIVVSDVRMVPMDGIALLKAIRRRLPHLPVVLMTAYAEVEKAVDAMRSGGLRFSAQSPSNRRPLLAVVDRYRLPESDSAGAVAETPQAVNFSRWPPGRPDRRHRAPERRVRRRQGNRRSPHPSPFGTPRRSLRGHQPVAIPESLLEATLFGYEKGLLPALSRPRPANSSKPRRHLASDEVTEMSLPLQAKLLRVLQEREVERVGGAQPVALDIRVIATSNRDLREAVAKGAFREDLYYRLNVSRLRFLPCGKGLKTSCRWPGGLLPSMASASGVAG